MFLLCNLKSYHKVWFIHVAPILHKSGHTQHTLASSAHFPLNFTPINSLLQNQRKWRIMCYNWHMLPNWMSLPPFKKHFWNAGPCFLLLERMRREWNIVTKDFQCFKENVVSSAHQVQQQEFAFTENTKNLDSSFYLAAWGEDTVPLHW